MDTTQLIVSVVAVVLILAIVDRSIRRRRRAAFNRLGLRERPRPQYHAQEQLAATAFAAIRNAYGDVFAAFSIERLRNAVLMSIQTKPAWQSISKFKRYLAVRFLWRSLQKATRTNDVTVLVDDGTPEVIRWTATETATFDDHGFLEPWNAKPGPVGTVVSGLPRRDRT